MLRSLFVVAIIVSLSAVKAQAENIRTKPYSYGYGDSVVAMSDDAFVTCGDCNSDKLENLPKQYVSIRVIQPKSAGVLDSNDTENVFEPPVEPVLAELSGEKPKTSGVQSRIAGNVLFKFDRDDLTQLEKKKLDTIVSTLPEQAIVSLSGYTCTIGTKNHNLKLSERRANTVARYLKAKGVKLADVNAKGECCQVSNTNHQANRRVEISEKGNGKND